MSAFHPYIRQTPSNFEQSLRSMFPDFTIDTNLAASLLVSDSNSAQPERSRRKRTTFSPDQAARLEQEYLNDCYMAREKRQILAQTLNLSENQVKTWFQNRRAKDKRDRKSHHTNSPPSSSPPPSPPMSTTNNNNINNMVHTPILASPTIPTNMDVNKMLVGVAASEPSPIITLNLLSDYAAYLQSLGAFQLPITSPTTTTSTMPLPTVPLSTVPTSFFTI